MKLDNLILVETALLRYLLSLPDGEREEHGGRWPVLCFLHGLGEGPPTDIYTGITAHGPLRPGSSTLPRRAFLVVAPQLPMRGDIWHRYADVVREIVRQVHDRFRGDPGRTCLTGFSFGGNGVFDLAVREPSFWRALWPVDPTRVPAVDPGLPVWLSSGEASRYGSSGIIERLGLKPPETGTEERVYVDEGLDHVGTATSAYRSERVYRWLLSI